MLSGGDPFSMIMAGIGIISAIGQTAVSGNPMGLLGIPLSLLGPGIGAAMGAGSSAAGAGLNAASGAISGSGGGLGQMAPLSLAAAPNFAASAAPVTGSMSSALSSSIPDFASQFANSAGLGSGLTSTLGQSVAPSLSSSMPEMSSSLPAATSAMSATPAPSGMGDIDKLLEMYNQQKKQAMVTQATGSAMQGLFGAINKPQPINPNNFYGRTLADGSPMGLPVSMRGIGSRMRARAAARKSGRTA